MIFILPNGLLGGAEKVVFQIIEERIRRGLSTSLVLLDDTGEGRWPQSERLQIYTGIQGVIHLIQSSRGRTVCTTHFKVSFTLLLLKILSVIQPSQLIVRESTSLVRRCNKRWKSLVYQIYYKLLYQADRVVAQTERMRREIVNQNMRLLGKVVVVNNPVKCSDDFSHVAAKAIAGLEKGKFLVVAGRLIELKNFTLAIDVLVSLNHSYRLVVLGEGPEMQTLKLYASERGVLDRIIFEGRVTHPDVYFRQASCCLLTSNIEGFPNVLLEMMAANNAVVSTRCAGLIGEIPGLPSVEVGDKAGFIELVHDELKIPPSSKSKFSKYLRANHSISMMNFFLE